MSTKTSIKRIALVAVSALGFGLLTVAPSNATAPLADTLTASSTSVSATSGGTSRVQITTAFLSTHATNSATQMTAVLTSAPALNTAVPVFETGTVTGATENGSPVRDALAISTEGPIITTSSSSANAYTRAVYNLKFVPVVSGTYTIRVSQTVGVWGSGTPNTYTASSPAANQAQPIFITYTVAAKPEVSPTASTFTWTAGTDATVSGTTTTGSILALRTVGTTRATLALSLSNGNASNALTAADQPSITATTDRGLIAWSDSAASFARTATYSSTNASLTPSLYVRGDGTSGTATITLSYVNAAGATVVLATRQVIFYSTTVASLTVEQNRKIISTSAGSVLGAAAADTANSGAVTVTALDSTGARVPGRSAGSSATVGFFGTSDNTACVSSTLSAVTEGDGSADGSPKGVYEINLGVGSAPTSGCVANVTISYFNSATSIIAATSFKVTAGGSTISSLTLTPDKSSYEPGEKVTLTLTAKDSAGNPIADGTEWIWGASSGTLAAATAPITSSTALTTNPFGKASGVANTYTFRDGKSSSTVFAPLTSGTVTLTSTLSAASTDLAAALNGTALATTFTVGASSAEKAAEAAADAAAEAIDAANAATDAANLAAEAADAATVAAEEARDAADAATAAVEELATQVATLMAALKAQITTLANTVAKIAKKVRA